MIELYKDSESKFRWRIKAGNRQIIAGSQQGYKTRAGALKGLASTAKAFFGVKKIEKLESCIKDMTA